MKYIICLSHIPWASRSSRTQQLLSRIPGVEILYFEPGASGRSVRCRGRKPRPNLSVYPLPLPYLPSSSLSMLQLHHRKKLLTHIRQIMTRRRVREAVIWCTTPEAATIAELLPRRCLLYDCGQEWQEAYVDLESELTFAADIVFAASPGLIRRLSPCSDNIALIPNGANPLLLSRSSFPPPATLGRIPDPILCRVGPVTEDLELEPLLQAASSHPEWVFLLLGQATEGVARRLHPFPNIRLLDQVPPAEFPSYLFASQALFDLIRSSQRGGDIIPARLFDYLATGKPIVTMVEPDAVEVFPDVIYTAVDGSTFSRRCQSALNECSPHLPRRRREYAKHATWSVRAQEVARILRDVSFL